MRKHRRVWLILLSLTALAALIWLILPARQPAEPNYQGKPLREWLALYTLGPGFGSSPADDAVRQIGTNAIPVLLEMLQEKDSPLKLKWIELLGKQHVFRPPQRATLRYFQATLAFRALGPTASNAAPALVQIYRRKISFPSQNATLGVLEGFGPAANPVLLDALSDTNGTVRRIAANRISAVHPQPDVFVPALINALKSSDADVRLDAINALAAYGPAAKSAVPALLNLLNDPDPMIQHMSAYALKQIGPEAAVPALINALKGFHDNVWMAAVNALADFGPDAKSAVPALVDLLNDFDPSLRASVTNALKKIDPESAANAGIK